MMYAELVDMEDFTVMIGKFGITASHPNTANQENTNSDELKGQIKVWLNQADDRALCAFWETIDRIEDDGILLPDVENIICWSRQYYVSR
ncbi:hypothetical protein SAMN02745781_03171 [Vibrio gazogenes DSM 21264]|uniref:Uncharacterized protein n=2 Tax=Vibrio gazogenes TaxID=687 RepID=A0A1M5EIU1_VIBGA|nr:hypothetical protein [Vibrio gazogenes]SHF79188.1 hypothetical protein SAMN02745781_03171 [Vibrio gazogenes DSM 21264] [Vibrio gazogenes DSM 21264 = NBRC 103151]SJN53998.1 hypothetical protein BQ6471_00759 [Vibrio gazogenes]